MIDKLDGFFRKIATGITVVIVFVIKFLSEYFIRNTTFYMVPILDFQESYDSDAAYSIISYIFYIQRDKQYITYELIHETALSFIVAFYFIIFVYYIAQGLISKRTLLLLALPLPIITMLVDNLESLGIAALVYYYPERLDNMVRFSSILTGTKQILWSMESCILIFGLIVYFFKRLGFPQKYGSDPSSRGLDP